MKNNPSWDVIRDGLFVILYFKNLTSFLRVFSEMTNQQNNGITLTFQF